MANERIQRRLATILAADVVGYSALMERAEEAISVSRPFDGVVRELFDGPWCGCDRFSDATERAIVLTAVKDAARR